MASVPVTDLLLRIEDAADMENFATEATLLRWLNAIHPRFRVKLAKCGWAPIISSYTITANGASSYTPTSGTPIEMLAIVAVWRVEGDEYIKLRPVDYMSRPGGAPASDAGWFKVSTLEAGGVSIELFPHPSSGEYVVDYIPVPSVLVTASPAAGQASSVNYPAGWEEWLVLQVARKCLAREESTNPALEREFAQVEKDIEEMCRDRVMSTAKVRNVDNQYDQIFDTSDWVWL